MTIPKQKILKCSLSWLLVLVLILNMGILNVFASEDEVVTIKDENLRKAICTELGKEYSEGAAITKVEITSLTKLVAENAGITDVTGLEAASNLETLDLSGNDLQTLQKSYNFFAKTNYETNTTSSNFPKLKNLDLSDCNIGGENGAANTLYYQLILPSLEILDMSGNNLYGVAGLGNNQASIGDVSYDQLKSADFSDNNFSGFIFTPVATFDALEKIDLSGNRIWIDEASRADIEYAWYQKILESNIADKVDFGDQSSLLELYGVYVDGDDNSYEQTDRINNSNHTIDLGSVISDSVSFALSYYGEFGSLNVQVSGTDTIKMVDNAVAAPATQIARTLITLEDLKEGDNNFELLFTHANGEKVTYTLKVSKADIPADPNVDSAGITDAAMQIAVCKKLNKDAGTYTVSKADMASLTGTLSVSNIENAQGVQYATGISTLDLSGDNFVSLPDIGDLNNGTLKSLTLKGYFTEVAGIEKLVKLTTLNLSGAERSGDTPVYTLGAYEYMGKFKTPDLSALNKLTAVKLYSSEMETSSVIGSQSLKTVNFYPAKDGSYPDLTGQTIATRLTLVEPDAATVVEYINSINKVGKIYLLDISGDYSLNGLQFGNGTKAELCINAGSADGETSLDIGGIKGKSTNENVILQIYNFNNYKEISTLHIKGSNGNVSKLDMQFGRFIFEEGLTMPSLQQLSLQDGCVIEAKLPDSFSNFEELTNLSIAGKPFLNNIIPSNFNASPALQELKVQDGSGTRLADDVDFSACNNLTKITIQRCENLILEGNQLPASLQTMDLTGTWKSLSELDYSNLVNLKELTIDSESLQEFPAQLVKQLPNLTTLAVTRGIYPTLPEDTFDNSTKLTSVKLGYWLQVVKKDGINVPVEGTTTARAINTLKENCPDVKLALTTSYLISSQNYCNLLSIASDAGEIKGKPFTETNLILQIPAGTEEIVIMPKALLEDTTITVSGKTYNSGEAITLPISSFNETFTITTHNDFTNYANLPTEKTYYLNVMQGEKMDEFLPKDGGIYSMDYHLMLEGSLATYSMADGYVSHLGEVRYNENAEAGKKYDVRFTITNTAWITDMKYKAADGSWQAADNVQEDTAAGTRTYRVYTDDVSKVIQISPYVVPMSKWPVCDLKLDLTSAVDISASVNVDKADLNAAINKALEITKKNNIYTEESYQAMTGALEQAQKMAAEETATQSAVDSAKKALVEAINGLITDESKLADKAELKAAIDTAKAIEKGKHTNTAWNALQEVITDAQEIFNTLEVTQSEVNMIVKSLNTAITLFNNSGEVSELDKDNLEDGTYSATVKMVKVDRASESMSNNAIDHKVKLEVKNGEYFITLDFKGLKIGNDFGYLSNLSYYEDGYTYGQYGNPEGVLVPAEVLTTQKNADGSDVIDQYNNADSLYPDLLKIKVVRTAITDADGYVALHVFVPIMEAISAGSGDQDVLMKIDWSTLKKAEEGEEPSPETKKGDVDGNGSVDLIDAQITLKAALSIIKLDDTQKDAADVDGTEGISLADAQLILKAALGIITL